MINNYYKENKEKLQKEAREKYKNSTEVAKDKKRQYDCDRYRNFLKKKTKRRVNMVENDIIIF